MDSLRKAQFSKPTSLTALPRILGRTGKGVAPPVPLTPCKLLTLRADRDAGPGREWTGAALVGHLLGPRAGLLLPVVVGVSFGREAMGAARGYKLLSQGLGCLAAAMDWLIVAPVALW